MTDTKTTSAYAMDGMPSAMLQKVPSLGMNKGLPSANMPVVPASTSVPQAPTNPQPQAPSVPKK
jgi:hypothetical protein